MLRPGAVTVTTSPGLNLTSRMKLPPLPSECATTRPLWFALRDPLTWIDPNRPGETPRKVICVAGDATWPPGIGNTYTVGTTEAAGARPEGPVSNRTHTNMVPARLASLLLPTPAATRIASRTYLVDGI